MSRKRRIDTNAPINVLHMLRDLSFGGPQNLVLDMIRGNREKNYFNYYVVYNLPSTQARLNDFSNGATVGIFKLDKWSISWMISYVKKLREIIRANDIQIVHCHSNIDAYRARLAVIPYNIKGFFHSRKNRKHATVVLTIHGMTLNLNYLSEFFLGAIDSSISEKTIRVLDRFFLKRCKICFESNAAKEFYLREYHQYPEYGDSKGGVLMKSTVIHNGVYVPRILNAKPISYEDLNSYVMHYPGDPDSSIPRGKMIFAMVGGFSSYAQRDQMLVCKAIDLLKKKRGELPFAFLFVGRSTFEKDYRRVKEQEVNDLYPDRDEMADCLNFCRDNNLGGDIFFMHPDLDVPSLLKTVSCYVYASNQDTFGISVVEAIIAGVDVICSNIPVFREITGNGELARLADNNPESFANAISHFLKYKLEEQTESEEDRKVDEQLDMKESEEQIMGAAELYSIERCLKEYKELLFN
ncbi:MAG: glycosyltransferase family 4 protein [Bacteroidales bacterium]|jgi:glycosyltransferase involved in cell wall biosynthesis|nr:glycosyltransferase family 4 protein [Bacteroidales bacterium]